ncbi:MAG: HisA/HisF-related TIM barrel protein, partial [Eubacteriales bacterium]|nr:HisA/HisF-related TIM barrel protein [Eubacteriales bacterium]
MKLRPCIDIHGGRVKQIVGGSIGDGTAVQENYVSEMDASCFAELYREKGLGGGHIILLDSAAATPEAYAADRAQAVRALKAFPGGMQIGGGITPDNAADYLEAGASHVIVTSYVFRDGILDEERLEKMIAAVGRERLVLDLSCRRLPEALYPGKLSAEEPQTGSFSPIHRDAGTGFLREY